MSCFYLILLLFILYVRFVCILFILTCMSRKQTKCRFQQQIEVPKKQIMTVHSVKPEP